MCLKQWSVVAICDGTLSAASEAPVLTITTILSPRGEPMQVFGLECVVGRNLVRNFDKWR